MFKNGGFYNAICPLPPMANQNLNVQFSPTSVIFHFNHRTFISLLEHLNLKHSGQVRHTFQGVWIETQIAAEAYGVNGSTNPIFPVKVKQCCLISLFLRVQIKVQIQRIWINEKQYTSKLNAFSRVHCPAARIVWRMKLHITHQNPSVRHRFAAREGADAFVTRGEEEME